MDKRIENAITYILRYAIAKGGKAYYNPCMYHLGFADNIPPSEEFNRELCKYGKVHYDRYIEYDFDYSLYDSWTYFEIDERGREYIEEKDKIINGSFGILKLLRYSASFVLSLLQLICVIEGWISYFLNFILKGISSILFFVAFISLIWWPLDMLCGLIWSSCDYLKHLIWNKGFTWEASVRRWINHFPQL